MLPGKSGNQGWVTRSGVVWEKRKRNALKHGRGPFFPLWAVRVDSTSNAKVRAYRPAWMAKCLIHRQGWGTRRFSAVRTCTCRQLIICGVTEHEGENDRLHLGFQLPSCPTEGYQKTAEGLNQGWRNGNVARPFRWHDSTCYGIRMHACGGGWNGWIVGSQRCR